MMQTRALALAVLCVLAFVGVADAQAPTPQPAFMTTSRGTFSLSDGDARYLKLDGSNTAMGLSITTDNVNWSASSASTVFLASLNTNLAGIAAVYAGDGGVFGVTRAYGKNAPGGSTALGTAAAGAAVFMGSGGDLNDVRYGSDSAVPVRFGNVNVERFYFTSSGDVVFNELSTNGQDFRVESDSNANGLVVDGAQNCVGVMGGCTAPFTVTGASTFAGNLDVTGNLSATDTLTVSGIVNGALSDTLGANHTSATTTLSDVLSVTLSAGVFNCHVFALISNTVVADGVKTTFDSSAITLSPAGAGQVVGTLRDGFNIVQSSISANAISTTMQLSNTTAASTVVVEYEATLLVGTGGALKFRAAMAAATTGLATVQRGATLQCRRLST